MEPYSLTGKLPTPIPAREPVSPTAPKKVSGKLFDLIMEGKQALAGKFPASNAPVQVQASWDQVVAGLDQSQSQQLNTDVNYLNLNSQAGASLFSIAQPSVVNYARYASDMVSELQNGGSSSKLSQFLQNPTLAKYAFQAFSGNLYSLL